MGQRVTANVHLKGRHLIEETSDRKNTLENYIYKRICCETYAYYIVHAYMYICIYIYIDMYAYTYTH